MYQIGYDIGGTEIKIGLVNDCLRIQKSINFSFPFGRSPEDIVVLMKDRTWELMDALGINLDKVQSIGIATAGSIDEKKGIIVDAYNLGFNSIPIVKMMQNHFPDKKICLINDADAATFAEFKAGSLYGIKTGVLITIGTGIGGGIILDGKLFTGGCGHGTEPGHMTLFYGGPLCSCGNKGCVETLCSATWLAEQGRIAVVKRPNSLIFEKVDGNVEKVTAKVVIDCAKEEDAAAKSIFEQYIDYLSSAIASIANIFDPEIIAIGGGISLAGNFLFQPLIKIVEQKSFFKIRYDIQPAKFGNNAGVIGAAIYSLSLTD